MSQHAAGPRAAGPRAAGPRAAGPRAAGPHAAGPHAAGPRASVSGERGVRWPLLAGICVALVLVTFAAFQGLTSSDFANYDDDVYVTDNPRVLAGLSLESVAWAFATAHGANWHPLTWLSHMLDVQL